MAKPESTAEVTLVPTAPNDGRDEMNLADFPISVLADRQPRRIDGGKVDTVVYEATRYDPVAKRRVPQRVTLLTNSQIGLPTPADENVVLGLLCLAKRTGDFTSPRVTFRPGELFRVLHWPADGHSYRRLRESLRRLKALTIRYENAWWDKDGREYQSEFATGIIAEYHLATQVRGRPSPDRVPENFIVWSPRFFESLQQGNLKKLDLEQLFALKLPTSQRIFRFLDKRFYRDSMFEMDLWEFACAHIGLTPTDNVAHIKQRLAPPIEELEGIGFLAKSEPGTRYKKIAPKVWRIALQKAKPLTAPVAKNSTAADLVKLFYRERFGTEDAEPLWKELGLAETLLEKHGTHAEKVVRMAVRLLRQYWPDGKTFVAIVRYLPEAEKLAKARLSQPADPLRESLEQAERGERAEVAKDMALLQTEWAALSPDEQHRIRELVLATQPFPLRNHPAIIERFCLLELQKQRQPECA